MKQIPMWVGIVTSMAGVVVAMSPAIASGARDTANFFSGPGNHAYLAAGVAQPLLLDKTDGRRRALRVVDSVVTATAASEILKLATHERRPGNSRHYNSFPSGHTTAAFALAANVTEYYPDQAPYWYLGAAAIGWSRVELRRHHTHDVLAGAALGYFVGKAEARSRRGLLLGPVYTATGAGLGFTWRHGW